VTIGTPVPAATPVPTGTATCAREAARGQTDDATGELSTVITLPPEPDRKLVNCVSAVLNEVSVPARAAPGPAWRERRRRGRAGSIRVWARAEQGRHGVSPFEKART
jgi:hypothetical protein